jgi:predicted nucleic acid-binding protein
MMPPLRLWPLDLALAQLYGEVYREVRRQGRVLSQVDMTIAALARQMQATILTSDKDFGTLPDIRTENWIG